MKKYGFLENPNEDLIKQYVDKFDLNERYSYGDNAIVKLLEKFPNNTSLEDVILKVSVINELYSTSIYSVFKMSQHIVECDIDENIKVGNPELINKIATGHNICTKKNNKEIRFYSFATKYCSWHNQEKYSIYDSFVEKTLIAYNKRDKFSKFNRKDLKDFKKFNQVILDFKSYYGLSNNTVKDIDKFLWMYGKERFPAGYKNN